MLKYLVSAFFVRPKVPGLGGIPVVVLATLGVLALTITKPILMLAGLGAIAAFCVSLAVTKRFRDLVDAQEFAVRFDLTDRGKSQSAKSRLLGQLRSEGRTRLAALEAKGRRILELHRTNGADAFLLQNSRDALEKLQEVYLRLLVGEQTLRKAEESAEAEPIRRQIAEVEASLREGELSGPARESRAATLEMLRLRLEKATTRDGSLAEIQSDLQRVETQIDLALDDAMLRGKPEAVSVNVELASRMLDPSLITGLDDRSRPAAERSVAADPSPPNQTERE
jgi:hypothetical protein